MSNEPPTDKLLVDQNEALDFYFDALLLPPENEQSVTHNELNSDQIEVNKNNHSGQDESTENSRGDTVHEVSESTDGSQSIKNFLQQSRQRQQKTQHNQSDPLSRTQLKKKSARKEYQPAKSSTSVTRSVTTHSIEQSRSINNKSVNPTIVFSDKSTKGEVSQQVLIPRSQQLAALKKAQVPSASAAKTIVNTMGEHTLTDNKILPDAARSKKSGPASDESSQSATMQNNRLSTGQNDLLLKSSDVNMNSSASIQEAPKLDLSLFLPKIKTLSDSEIAQQIEALTQAAVTQAQIKSERVHEAKIQQLKAQSTIDEGPIRNIDNAPTWAIPDFQALLFTVAGLKMAVPLCELNAIVEWGDEYITELPGHKPWYLGIIQNQGKNIPVIDTLQLVVPEERWPAKHVQEKNFKHIILIDEGRWGLACETVLEVVSLKTDAVKWRSSRTKRRWLLGTVIEHMCALLDSSEFAAMLKTGDNSLLN